MENLIVTLTTFSTEGILPNIFSFLAPFADLAGNVKTLIGLLPKK